MSEKWLPVAGYEGIYEVSDRGSVRSVDRIVVGCDGKRKRYSGRSIRPWENDTGHLAVTLYRGGAATKKHWMVHRLVAFAFIGPPSSPSLEVCHSDGEPRNNDVTNLRWDTRSANILDAVKHGRHHVANRTHCIRGHEFSAENTIYQMTRKCRCCADIKNAETRQRRANRRDDI